MSISRGEGPGSITRDGCAVEVYRRLPGSGDPELIGANVPRGCSILDLGTGAGRLADPLALAGHSVTAVDDSPAMLALVRHARTICSRIEDLELPERFDVVLLASRLINAPDAGDRHRLLMAAARHVAHGGSVLIEWSTPEWFEHLRVGRSDEVVLGGVRTWLTVHSIAGDLVDSTVSYEIDAGHWDQHFVTRRLSHAALGDALAAAGLRFSRTLEGRPWWIEALT